MNLLNMLLGSMTTSQSTDSLAGKTGLSASQIKKIVAIALPILLKFLTKNASSESGATSLLGALTQHTSKKSMPEQLTEADTEDGGKIIGHILGDQSEEVLKDISEKSGADASDVAAVLSNLAPGLLSGVSAAADTASEANKQEGFDLSNGLDLSDLSGFFGGSQGGFDLFGSLGSLFGGNEKDSESDGSDLLNLLLSFGK